MEHVNENGLTRSSLLELFGRHCEGEEYFYHYLDHHIIHSGCRGDLGIYIEVSEKVLD